MSRSQLLYLTKEVFPESSSGICEGEMLEASFNWEDQGAKVAFHAHGETGLRFGASSTRLPSYVSFLGAGIELAVSITNRCRLCGSGDTFQITTRGSSVYSETNNNNFNRSTSTREAPYLFSPRYFFPKVEPTVSWES